MKIAMNCNAALESTKSALRDLVNVRIIGLRFAISLEDASHLTLRGLAAAIGQIQIYWSFLETRCADN